MKPSKISNTLKALVVAAALPLLYLADASPDNAQGLTLLRAAHAVVGAPLTPMSVAGVARRTTARAAVASTSATSQQQAAAARPASAPPAGAVVNALPAGCKPETRDGVEFQNCGGVIYRAAFQGNNLVYVVQ
jgi:hypothetical protein